MFELTAPADRAAQVEQDYEIVSRTAIAEGVSLRGVTANGLPDGATAVESPTLEEAYLTFMAARGRSDAARQDEDEAPS